MYFDLCILLGVLWLREVLILFFNFVPNSDGIYVRLNGHLRSSGGNRQLVAFSVRYVFNTFDLLN